MIGPIEWHSAQSTDRPKEAKEILMIILFKDAFDLWEDDDYVVKEKNNDCLVTVSGHYIGGKWWLFEDEEVTGKVLQWAYFPMPERRKNFGTSKQAINRS